MTIIDGSDLTGVSGGTDRKYTITDTTFVSSTLKLYINGLYQYPTTDYSLSSSVITFVNAIFDDQVIAIEYDTVASSTGNLSYGTTIQLARFMNIESSIPDKSLVGEDRDLETVGVGDSATTVFWLDNAYVIDDSYTLLYGASSTSVTELTETTHYVIDKDTGKITLTATGLTVVSTNNIYASYSYTSSHLTDTQLAEALARAKQSVDDYTNSHFATATDATPDWNQVLDEEHDGKGIFDRNYFTYQKYPIPSTSTTLNGEVTADDATITVTSTNGFPSTGYIGVGDDKIQYTGKTSTTFTGCTSVSAHDDASTVKPYVIEISTTEPGGTISWQVLNEGTEFELDKKTGRIHLYAERLSMSGTYTDIESVPIMSVPNRFRLSYVWGNSTIPANITQATLMYAAKDLMATVVRMAHVNGLNDFDPALLKVDQEDIDKILSRYRNEQYARI